MISIRSLSLFLIYLVIVRNGLSVKAELVNDDDSVGII
jgi:hypothetical protein